MQWDAREVSHKVALVAFTTGGVLAVTIVLGQVLFVVVRGLHAALHLNMWTQSMAFASPLSPLSVGGVLHAIVGTLEQIGLGTLFSVPLGLLAATFLAEVGGKLARPTRTIVEAMTALPDVIAGLFIYALFILTLGMQKSGLAASLALAITMMPIVARASEVVIRLVPGTLREASYALGSSQWRTVLNVVLPTARAGLATAVVLAMARGIGETAPVLVVSGVTKEFNFNPLSGPQVSLPLYIWEYAHIEAVNNTIVTRAFGGAVALIVVVLLLFALARRLGGAAPGELTRRQRRRLARQRSPGMTAGPGRGGLAGPGEHSASPGASPGTPWPGTPGGLGPVPPSPGRGHSVLHDLSGARMRSPSLGLRPRRVLALAAGCRSPAGC